MSKVTRCSVERQGLLAGRSVQCRQLTHHRLRAFRRWRQCRGRREGPSGLRSQAGSQFDHPETRCPGSGRSRWMTESPPSALPGPYFAAAARALRRQRAGGRPRRTGDVSGIATLPRMSCPRHACVGGRCALRCRCGAGRCRPCTARGSVARRLPARDRRWWVCSPLEASMGAVPVQDAKWLRSGKRATSATSASIRAAPAGPMPWMSIRCDPAA